MVAGDTRLASARARVPALRRHRLQRICLYEVSRSRADHCQQPADRARKGLRRSTGVNVPRGADRDGPWPDGSRVSVSLTFDVDAEAALLGLGLDEATRYSAFTERRFGIARGLPRVLALLAEHGIRGTFYVPGYTADRYPDDVSAIVEGGHEVAHHGYFHLPPTGLDAAGQREELERGKAALEKLTGRAPKGYRSPSWDVTEETFSLLGELGFEYDS